jgi:hypothetical protein
MYNIFDESVVVVVFQNVLYLEMHQNNIYIYILFLKNYF